MSDVDTALDLLRSANPIETIDALDPSELEASVAACTRTVDEADHARRGGVAVVPLPEAPVSARRSAVLRPVVVGVAAFAIVVMAVVTIGFMGRIEEPPAAPDEAPSIPVTTVAPTMEESGAPYEVAVERRLVYWTDGETTFTLDVYHPSAGEGPWPVVVAFPQYAAGVTDAVTAREMARRGAVAFAPVTVPGGTRSPWEYIDGMDFDRGSCAVGFAQAHAREYAGDPERTTVMGAAGGDHQSVWSAFGLIREDVCEEPILHAPVGLVAGLPQWLFELAYWDEPIADPLSNARDTLDRFWNPSRWQAAEKLQVHLWTTASTSNQRPIEQPISSDSWIHSRDTTGTLVDDLETVGAFSDGTIGFNDNARAMYLRMRRAGISVTLDEMATTDWQVESTQYDRIWSIVSGE